MARVVHVTSVHKSSDARIFQKECLSLLAAGHEVTLVAPHGGAEQVDGVRVVPVPTSEGRLRRVFGTSRRAMGLAACQEASIYHLHDPELLLWKGMLEGGGAVVVYDMHEDLPKQIRNKRWVPGPLRPLLGFLAEVWEERVLRKMPTVLAETSYATSRPWLARKVEVLNFPRLEVMATMTSEGGGTREFKVGYLGAVTAPRGSLRYLEAMAIVKDRLGEEIPLELVGKVEETHRAEIKARAASLGLTRVLVTGHLPPREGWARMGSFGVGLSALAPSKNFVESYPTKLFEYMSVGIPPVVSDFPLYRKVVENSRCGILVDPMDPVQIAQAIIDLKENPGLAAKMAAGGRAAALRDYSWESQAGALVKFYEGLLAGS